MNKFLLIFIFNLVFIFSFVNSQCQNLCLNGFCFSDECACGSGFVGNNCSQGDTDLCVWGELENLYTSHVPEFLANESSLSGGNLTLSIASPLVTNRLYTIIQVGDQISEGCSYPNSDFWSKEVSLCKDKYVVVIPWIQIKQCGFKKDTESDAEHTSYVSQLKISHHDKIDEFRGNPITRDTEHIIPIRIRFQTVVEVSTQITIFAPVVLLAAITEQTYDPEISEGTLELTTNLPPSFILTVETLTGSPEIVIPILSLQFESCNDTSVSCTQSWKISIDPSTACSLSGFYVLNFTLSCFGECEDLDTSVQLILDVNSEDICSEVAFDIGLTGFMSVFSDQQHLIPQDNFLLDEIVHFKANLQSEAVIIDNQLLSVWIQKQDSSILLLENSNLTENGLIVNFETYTSGNDWNSFSFFTHPLITPVDTDIDQTFDIFAKIVVTYQDTENQKRFVLQQQTTSTTSTQFLVGNNEVLFVGQESSQDISNVSEKPFFLLILISSGSVFICCFIFVIFFVVRKRNQDQDDDERNGPVRRALLFISRSN